MSTVSTTIDDSWNVFATLDSTDLLPSPPTSPKESLAPMELGASMCATDTTFMNNVASDYACSTVSPLDALDLLLKRAEVDINLEVIQLCDIDCVSVEQPLDPPQSVAVPGRTEEPVDCHRPASHFSLSAVGFENEFENPGLVLAFKTDLLRDGRTSSSKPQAARRQRAPSTAATAGAPRRTMDGAVVEEPTDQERPMTAVDSTARRVPHINDFPANVLRQVLLGGTHRRPLCFVSTCAAVCSEWWHILHDEAVYGIGIQTPAPARSVRDLLRFCQEAPVWICAEEEGAEEVLRDVQGRAAREGRDWTAYATEKRARCMFQSLIETACADRSRPDVRFVVRRSFGLRYDPSYCAMPCATSLRDVLPGSFFSAMSVSPRLLEDLAAGLSMATRAYVLWEITMAVENCTNNGWGFTANMPIGDAGVAALSATIEALPPEIRTLTHLKLPSSGLTPAAVPSLAPALAFLGNSECNCVCGANKQEFCLSCSLDLSMNPGLGDEGLVALAECLPPTLHMIDISYTNCGDRGFVAIVAKLPTLPYLKDFRCGYNPLVGIQGWLTLRDVLSQRTSLRRIKGVPPGRCREVLLDVTIEAVVE